MLARNLPRALPRNVRKASLRDRVEERRKAPRELVTSASPSAPISASLGGGTASSRMAARATTRTLAATPARPSPSNERRPSLALPTPTPPPAVVDASPTTDPTPPASRDDKRGPLVTLAAFLVLAVFAAVALKKAAVGLPAVESKADLLALVDQVGPKAKAAGAHVAAVALGDETTPNESDAVADAAPKLRREGHVSIPGGILVFPETFHPRADGAFDVYVHFHGNTSVVRESAEVAKLDAAVAIVNLGVGSAPYEEYYSMPGAYEDLLADVTAGVERRGVPHAHVKRVALGAWSAGYGAVSSILLTRKRQDPLDAILIYDGIHCGWEGGVLNPRQMKPFVQAAQSAARGEIYFGITHSDIDPKTYASSTATADYLIDAVGAKSGPLDPVIDAPSYLELESMKGAVAKRREKSMEPTSEARIGNFHVTGYRGETKEHHMAHLFQMGATLLPELVARWSL